MPTGPVKREVVATQVIAQGPVASQEVIKMYGTNGGGFFGANSSHPFENPTPLTNFVQMLLIFAIPSGAHLHPGADDGLATAWLGSVGRDGRDVSHRSHRGLCRGVPRESAACGRGHNGSEGAAPAEIWREKRCASGRQFGALSQLSTTDASCGAVNNQHDSLTPFGGMIPLINMMLGEVIFGGVGAGMYGSDGVRYYGGVHRRDDGGTYAGVSGEEDRGV